jgi:arylsulfatase A-like enzyme
MLVLWPGHVPAGRVVEAPSMNIDLFPTFLALAGLDGPGDRVIDGRDLRALLLGEGDASPHEALFFFNANVVDGVRAGRWKYYRFVNEYVWPVPLDKPNTWTGQFAANDRYTDPRSGRSTGLLTRFPLLYDVTADRDESYGVADRHPEEARRLDALIARWEQEFVANPRGWR